MKNPGSAGLTADRLGDADKWLPKTSLPPNDGEAKTAKTDQPLTPNAQFS